MDDRIPWGRIAVISMVVIVGILAFSYVLRLGFFGADVATSGIRGQGGVIIEINKAENRIESQQWFEQVYGDIKSYSQQIVTQEKALAGYRQANTNKPDPVGNIASEDARLSQVVTGLKNQCVSAVNDYNAEARKVLAEQWRSPELPNKLNTADFCVGGQ